MQRMGGGGNNPACGCDMQAGWPSASEFPRGGIQGGGKRKRKIKSFKLLLKYNNGSVMRFRGFRNGNGQTKKNMNSNAMSNAMSNANVASLPTSPSLPDNTKVMTSAPNMKKMPINGKPVYVNNEKVYEMKKDGSVGSYKGTLKVNKNGKKTIVKTNETRKTGRSLSMNEFTGDDVYNFEAKNNMNTRPLSQDGGSMPVCGSCPFPGTGYCDFYARGGSRRGGGCGCAGRFQQTGGDCGCNPIFKGGYRATKRNLKYLKKWKRGESIGFTMTSSLKAKGLIPRTSKTMKGKRMVSKKYKH